MKIFLCRIEDFLYFCSQKNESVLAIEVKSGKIQMNCGLAIFRERFKPRYSLVVGGDSMPLESFFNGDIENLL